HFYMKRLSDGLGPTQDPEERPDPRPEPPPPALTGPPPGEAQPSLDPDTEMDERFKKCPWLFRKGNTTGQHRQRRSQLRLRMENRPPHVVRVDWPDMTNSLGSSGRTPSTPGGTVPRQPRRR